MSKFWLVVDYSNELRESRVTLVEGDSPREAARAFLDVGAPAKTAALGLVTKILPIETWCAMHQGPLPFGAYEVVFSPVGLRHGYKLIVIEAPMDEESGGLTEDEKSPHTSTSRTAVDESPGRH